MGFFDNYGTTADAVSENPFSIPFGSYPVVISDAEIKQGSKDKTVDFFVIEYEVASGEHAGKTASTWFRTKPLTAADDKNYAANNARTLSNFKKALLDIGLNEAQINAFDPYTHGSKLRGIRGTAKMGPQKNNPEYNSISNFTRNSGASTAVTQSPGVSEEMGTPVSDSAVSAEADDLLANWA
jgi:hypothetical protein